MIRRVRVLAVAATLMLALAACGGGGGGAPAPTFTQDGYVVTCQWTGSAIVGQPTPVNNNEALSFCRSRAREAAGTVTAQTTGANVSSVTIAADGSATVCYGVAGATCAQILGPLPR